MSVQTSSLTSCANAVKSNPQCSNEFNYGGYSETYESSPYYLTPNYDKWCDCVPLGQTCTCVSEK